MLHDADKCIGKLNGQPTNHVLTTLVLTVLALVAFAANTVLCRMALAGQNIDAASFTSIRLLSGAFVLMAILQFQGKGAASRGNWISSLMLFLYAITFSFAYISLDTGTGALILFGAVQITMILVSVATGNRLHFIEWAGAIMAFAGFAYLVSPGVTAPSLTGFVLMCIAGMAWGIYTLRGRGSADPLADTAYNFFRTTPLVVVAGFLSVIVSEDIHLNKQGVMLAVLSGAIASGIGYTIWYSALRGLSATQAAIVQLSVPLIAAIGGIVFMAEMVTLRLAASSVMILGGILLVVIAHSSFLKQHRVNR
jgi:drug/metabolite transporter (DMT)-like permease